jgi:UDP-N-acetylglucosamine 2-epimerase (non-hydrolysing)
MIHFVVGTRAQLFKLAPVMLECERRGLVWRWVYTAQHRDTIRSTIDLFRLPAPDFVVVRWDTEAKSMARMGVWFARMVAALVRSRTILAGHTGKRHVVLTHGDTFTTWFGALFGRLTRTRVMHVESGLRSFNLRRPFPEELNRVITFRLAQYYACPGAWAARNLEKRRGLKLDTGANTQVDTLRFGLSQLDDLAFDVPSTPYVVVSLHRYENIFDRDRLTRIVEEIEGIANDFEVLFIQHPATQLQLDKLALRERLERTDRISLLPRLEYLPFLKAIRSAEFVVTDGGGNQEELSYLGKPTLILRDETERHEGLGRNAALAGLDHKQIRDFVRTYLTYARPEALPAGSPSAAIVDFLQTQGFGRS